MKNLCLTLFFTFHLLSFIEASSSKALNTGGFLLQNKRNQNYKDEKMDFNQIDLNTIEETLEKRIQDSNLKRQYKRKQIKNAEEDDFEKEKEIKNLKTIMEKLVRII